MGHYRGKTYQIPQNIGGFNHNNNIDLIPPEAMVDGSRNVNLTKGGREKRGGTSVVNTTPTPITGTPRGMGIHHYLLEDGTSFVVVAMANAKIYQDTPAGAGDWGNDITGASWTQQNKVVEMIIAANTLYIFDGANIPQSWDGSAGTTSDITTVAADWTGTNQPKGMIARTRSFDASLATARTERIWAWGCANNPNRLYFSSNYGGTLANLETFAGGTSGNIDVVTGHGDGIIAMIEWGQRFFAFTKTTAYIVDDSPVAITDWGYYPAQWGAGVGGQRLVIKVPNDLIAMAEDGEIYSVLTAQEYGDYKMASLTRGSFMHEWIKENVDLTNIADFHTEYDPVLRVIKFFVRRKTIAHVDTALLYFIDRPPNEAWSIADNQSFDSGYKASASALVRSAIGTYKVYTIGWDDGYVWELETSNKNDNSQAFPAGTRTPRLMFDDPTLLKRYDSLKIICKPEGSYNLDIDWWVDKVQQSALTVDLSPDGSFILGTSQLGTGTLGGQDLIEASVNLGVVGTRIQFDIHNNRVDEDFFLSQTLINFKPLSKKR